MKCKRTVLALFATLTLGPAFGATSIATLGHDSTSITADPVLRRVFVSNHGSDTVSTVDLDTGAVRTTSVAGHPRRIISNAATHRLYVMHDGSPGLLTVMDETEGSILAEIPLGDHPSGMVADFRKGELYVINRDGGTVSFVDAAANAVLATLTLGTRPTGVDINSLAGKIYISSSFDGSVTVVDRATRAIETRVAVGGDPQAPVVDEASGKVYVNNARDNTVSVMAGAAGVVSKTIRVGAGSTNGVISAVYHRYFLPNAASGTVSVIDTGTDERLADVVVGTSPQQVAVDAAKGALYVVNKISGTVSVADAASGRVSATIDAGTNPSRIAFTMGHLVVLSENGIGPDSLSLIDSEETRADTAIATEYYHADFSHYFSSAEGVENRLLTDGIFGDAWERSMQFFRVWTAPGQGRFPVCRFFGGGFGDKSSHVLTPYPAQCESLKHDPNWTFEGVSYWLALPDGAGNCATGTEPLYRLYNNGSGGAPNHRLTRVRETRDRMAIGGWIAEGAGPDVIFACAPPLVAASPQNAEGIPALSLLRKPLPAVGMREPLLP